MTDVLLQGLVAYFTVVVGMLVLFLYVVCWGLSLLALFWGHLYLHVRDDLSLYPEDAVPGVSIVKPLAGVDPLLETRLETHFTLTFPRYELLFCFHDDQDPAIAVVRKLQVKYPRVPVRLLFKCREDIPNTLVHNLIQGYEAANYDYVWVCSSKLQVSEDMVEDMVRKLQPADVGLVHQLPSRLTSTTASTLSTATTVQQLYYSCTLGRYYLSFNMVGMCCVAGLSYMLKKSVLEQRQQDVQSLALCGHYMPHDFFLARDLHLKSYKTVMSSFPAEETGVVSLSGFVDRMVRWSRLRLSVLTLVTGVLEPLSQCLPLGMLTSCFLFLFFDIRPLNFLFCHLLAWMVVDILLLKLIGPGPQPPCKERGILHFLYSWAVCQAMCVWVWVKALSAPHRIRWGPHTYHLHCGGRPEGIQYKL